MMTPGITLENKYGAWGGRDSISLSFKRDKIMLMTMRLRKIREPWVLGFSIGA